jgi:hypothetical protein
VLRLRLRLRLASSLAISQDDHDDEEEEKNIDLISRALDQALFLIDSIVRHDEVKMSSRKRERF